MTPSLKRAAEAYGAEMKVLRGQFVSTEERLAMAFLAGAMHALELAAKECDKHLRVLREYDGKPASLTTCLRLRENIRAIALGENTEKTEGEKS